MPSFFHRFRDHYRANLHLAIPVVISQLGHTLVHTADSIIVGHFAGTIPLAAVSLVNSIFTVVLMIGIGISYGLTPLIAQASGRGNFRECGRLLTNSLVINLIIGILLFFLVFTVGSFLIGNMDQEPEVVREARPFLRILSVSIIPLMVFQTFRQFAEGLGYTRQSMMVSIWGNIINVVLGIIFVKGLFGIEPMGVSGVGWSTLIDRMIMASVMAWYVLNSINFRSYLGSFRLRFIDTGSIKRIMRLGAPVAMQYTFEISAFSAAAIMIGTISAVEQAAHQVAISLAATTYMMASGVSAAATIRTGQNFGRKNFNELRMSALASYHVVVLFMMVTALIFIFGNDLLPWMYTSDRSVISIAAGLLIIAGLFQLFDGTQVVGLGVLRGIGDVNIPTFITFLAYWVIGLPVGYFLGIYVGLGSKGIWYGLTLGLFVSASLLYLRFNSMTRKLLTSTI